MRAVIWSLWSAWSVRRRQLHTRARERPSGRLTMPTMLTASSGLTRTARAQTVEVRRASATESTELGSGLGRAPRSIRGKTPRHLLLLSKLLLRRSRSRAPARRQLAPFEFVSLAPGINFDSSMDAPLARGGAVFARNANKIGRKARRLPNIHPDRRCASRTDRKRSIYRSVHRANRGIRQCLRSCAWSPRVT